MTFGFINTNEASASCRAEIYLRLKVCIAQGAASLRDSVLSKHFNVIIIVILTSRDIQGSLH